MLCTDDYERKTAIILHAALTAYIRESHPTITISEKDNITLAVIDRMARMRGYAIRREIWPSEEEG